MTQPEPATFVNCVVGEITSCKPIPDSSKLYVCQVDIGNDQVRQIVTAARKFYTTDDLVNKKVCVFENCEKCELFDKESEGMLLGCASDEKHVELLEPPLDCSPGDRIYFGEFTDEEAEETDHNNKYWRKMQQFLKVNENGDATYKDQEIYTDFGNITAPTLRNCPFH